MDLYRHSLGRFDPHSLITDPMKIYPQKPVYLISPDGGRLNAKYLAVIVDSEYRSSLIYEGIQVSRISFECQEYSFLSSAVPSLRSICTATDATLLNGQPDFFLTS